MRGERRKEAQSAKTWLSIPDPALFFSSSREHDWQGWSGLYSCLYSVYLSTQSPQGQRPRDTMSHHVKSRRCHVLSSLAFEWREQEKSVSLYRPLLST